MIEKLTADFAVAYINTVCTLKCKHCIALTPYQREKVFFETENIEKDIDAIFQMYEYVGHFDFEGGETLLSKNLPELVRYTLTYKKQFKQINILTNGTVIPSKELLEICRENNIFFIIGDYGEKRSVKINDVKRLLDEYGIKYRCDTYHGSDQYYNGWIDFGEFKAQNLSREDLFQKASKCFQSGKMARTMNGKLFKCTIQMAQIRHIPLVRDEYVDLHDTSKSLGEKRALWQTIQKNPVAACDYCNGFLTDGPRVPAAEQFKPDELTEDMKICSQIRKI